MPEQAKAAPLIFISYAHADNESADPNKRWLDRLCQHLQPLIVQEHLALWSDRALESGEAWHNRLCEQLEHAGAAVLLVSPAFLASKYIRDSELPVLLKNAKDRGVVIIPVILRPCLFKETRFKYPDPAQGPDQLSLSILQSANPPTKPLNALAETEQDQVLLAIAQRLLKLAENIPAKPEDTLAADPGTGAVALIGNVPRRNPFFTGREEIFQALKEALASEQTVVLTGLGGMGKTETAVEFVHQHGKTYEWVFWVTAESRETLIADLSAIARHLDLPGAAAADQMEIVGRVLRWLDSHQNWLLVFDDADDLAVMTAFLPRSRTGHILLTSRAHATSYLGLCLNLQTLTPQQGALLLLRRAKLLKSGASFDALPELTRHDALQISQTLDGLPLALDQAGAFLEETRSSPVEYLRLYHTERARLLAEQGGVLAKHPSVFVTFSLAYNTAVGSHPAAEALLRLSAFLTPEGIPEHLFTEGVAALDEPLSAVVAHPLELANLFKEVGRLSLMHRDPERPTFSIHRLVQAVIQDMMDEETRRAWAERAVLLVNRAFPSVNVDSWARCEEVVPQALACATTIERWDMATEEAAHLLNEAGYYLTERARYAEAEPLYQRALAIYERVLGPDHPDTASSLNNLAELYRHQGLYAEAKPLYQRALSIRERVLGPDHPETASSLNNLAELYWHERLYAQAEPLYQRALSIRERILGSDHPDTASSLNNLAGHYTNQGQYAEAKPLYQRALAIRERILGPDHPDTATSLNNVAVLYHKQGEYAEAESLYQRALAICERVLGADHPDTATSLNNLARLYRDQGQYAEAEPLYQRALAICERILGPDHPDTASSLNSLAVLYHKQGQYAEAEPLYQRALAIRERILGPDHPEMATSLNHLAGLYDNQGQYAEAEPLYQRALSIRERVLGPDHPETATSLNDLAGLYHKQGQYAEAEPLYQRALAIRERVLGSDHPDTARSVGNLVQLYRAQGNLNEAAELQTRLKKTDG